MLLHCLLLDLSDFHYGIARELPRRRFLATGTKRDVAEMKALQHLRFPDDDDAGDAERDPARGTGPGGGRSIDTDGPQEEEGRLS